jgi:hypothetical protein
MQRVMVTWAASWLPIERDGGQDGYGLTWSMTDFPIAPPIFVKDEPKPRRIQSIAEARAFVAEQMRIGRPQPWREVEARLKAVNSEEDAIEAAGDLRELLAEEDLLLPHA